MKAQNNTRLRTLFGDNRGLEVLKERVVYYIYAQAFTTCDCGNELMLSQIVFNNPVYTGSCSCGKSYSLNKGKLSATNN